MAFELPKQFEDRMREILGDGFAAFRDSYEKERNQGLRLNLLKTDPETWEKQNPFHLRPVPWASEGTAKGFYYGSEDRPGLHPYHAAGVYYMQEPSAMLPAELIGADEAGKNGEWVLDLCAAPGGKTTQTASGMQGGGLLIANEIDPARSRILSQNVERMGIRNCIVTNSDPDGLVGPLSGKMDRILVDAPCSGEGMFRKEDAALAMWSEDNVAMCAERQEHILEAAYEMLAPGGRIVYSTCTFAPAEDELQVERFLEKHPDMHAVSPDQEVNGVSAGIRELVKTHAEEIGKTFRIWPHISDGEGHYAAVLRSDAPKLTGSAKTAAKKTKGAFRSPDYRKIYLDAAAEIFREPEKWCDESRLIQQGECLWLLPTDRASMPLLSGIRVLRQGILLGTFARDRFEPDHSLAMALHPEEVRLCRSYAADSEEIRGFLHGEPIREERSGEKGWTLITVDGYSLGWAKLGGGTLKNHYPKGLRTKY